MIGHTSIKVDGIYITIDREQQADAVKAIPDALRCLCRSYLQPPNRPESRLRRRSGDPTSTLWVTQGRGRQEGGARQDLIIRKVLPKRGRCR